MKNKKLVKLDNRQAKIVASVFESLHQTHVDLAELCAVVCSGECLSVKAFSEIRSIQKRIDDVCNKLEAPPADHPLFDVYEEIDLADGFLSSLILTIWTAEKSPTSSQLLEWREATVVYAVLFSTMHRIENALNAFEDMKI